MCFLEGDVHSWGHCNIDAEKIYCAALTPIVVVKLVDGSMSLNCYICLQVLFYFPNNQITWSICLQPVGFLDLAKGPGTDLDRAGTREYPA